MIKKIIPFLFISNLIANESLNDLSLEELMNVKVYSATKDYRSIEEIPANITILTRKDIEKYNYKTLDELLKNVPGLFVFDDTENFQVGSRGSIGSSFQLMLNNNPIFSQRFPYDFTTNRNFFSIPVKSIDRIEIVKGPQAVTYGANSMYGSINIITNDFNEQKEFSFLLGNNNQRSFFNRISHSYKDGGFTLNSNFHNTDGINNPKTQFNETSILDDKFKNKYKTFDFSNRYKNLTTDIFYSEGYNDLAIPIFRNEFKQFQNERAISFTYEENINQDLSYKINYINSNKKLLMDDHNNYPIFDKFDTNSGLKYEKDKLDLHFNYLFNENLKFLLGTSYEKQSYNYFSSIYNFYPSGLKYNDFRTKDLYGKIYYHINNNFEINTGIRKIFIDDFDTNSFADYGESYPTYSYNTNTHIEKKDFSLPEVSLIYHLNQNNHLKFLFAKANQLQKNSNNTYENITSQEINHLYISKYYNISSSIFLNETKNIYANDYTSIGVGKNNSYETRGLEFALTYKPNYNLQTSTSLTYQHSKNLENKDLEQTLFPEFLAKNSISYTLFDTTYSLWLNYLSKMKANRDSNGISYGNDSNHNLTINSNINHKLNSNTSLDFYISNLLDRKNTTPASGIVYHFQEGFYTPSRAAFLALNYKF